MKCVHEKHAWEHAPPNRRVTPSILCMRPKAVVIGVWMGPAGAPLGWLCPSPVGLSWEPPEDSLCRSHSKAL